MFWISPENGIASDAAGSSRMKNSAQTIRFFEFLKKRPAAKIFKWSERTVGLFGPVIIIMVL
ncbi:MAG TPA: hypothetical protein PKK26_09240, partial [Candidatus Wallbacteria bacterium]|nr:hypothetical protein [Candidatus Wallbacteria bacterium]